jgi:hypothetical protein
MIRRPTRREFNKGDLGHAKSWPDETQQYLKSLQYEDFVAALESCATEKDRKELMRQKLLFTEGD